MIGPAFQPAWIAVVQSTADRLDGELHRSPDQRSPDGDIVRRSLQQARVAASRPSLLDASGRPVAWGRQLWRRFGAWWTGLETDAAWAALHTAGEALVEIQAEEVVRSQLGDLAASVVTSLSDDDLRVKDYLATLEMLAEPTRPINVADRAQLRSIRQACDNSSDSAHADARAFRNTLLSLGAVLALVLVGVAALAAGDTAFRSLFVAAGSTQGRWYVFELELVASLAGIVYAVLGLKSYTGFQFSYGLPFVQTFLKGGTGAATGLFGVVLVQGKLVSALQPQSGGGVLAVAVIFGAAQYLFTRLVDQQANKVLSSASSRNDPGSVPQVSSKAAPPSLLTTEHQPAPTPQPGAETSEPKKPRPRPSRARASAPSRRTQPATTPRSRPGRSPGGG